MSAPASAPPLELRADLALIWARYAQDCLRRASEVTDGELQAIWVTHALDGITRCIDKLEDRWT